MAGRNIKMNCPQSKISILSKVSPKIQKNLQSCTICPKNCKTNRLNNQNGYCQESKEARIHKAFLHFGEEPPISGKNGSGTIFFSGCNLKCVYCQNYKFSQMKEGNPVTDKKLAQIMLNLAKNKAENINLVTPSHFLPSILTALMIAFRRGLNLPLVYNSSGYEKKSIIMDLEPLIDCWLLDFKYISPETAKKYSNSPKYPGCIKKLILHLSKQKKSQKKPIFNQIPPLIIRHLILPGHIEESKEILCWIKKNSPNVPVSIMSQYQPYFKAKKYSKINRPLNRKEYRQIRSLAEKLKLNGWLQKFSPQENLAGVYF